MRSKVKNKPCIVKVIILAAGYSRRMRAKLPKQLFRVGKKPILAYTLDVFERCKSINSIILAVHKKHLLHFQKLLKKYKYQKIEQLVIGGKTRQQSVYNSLKHTKHCDYVIIHDGVRPFITEEIIVRVIKAAKQFSAATTAVPAVDTIVEAKKGFIKRTLRRKLVWHIQTPQGFKFDLIYQAHQKARAKKIIDASDDAQLLLGLKKKVRLIAGSYRNIKITTKADLLLTRALNKIK